MTDIKAARAVFNSDIAPALAAALGHHGESLSAPNERFAVFDDGSRRIIVAGGQEQGHVQLALARALGTTNRRLVLVLPAERCNATRQRLPWLRADRRPTLHLHDGRSLVDDEAVPPMSQQDTIDALLDRLAGTTTPTVDEEFRSASTAKHFGQRSRLVTKLVEWASSHDDLTPAHRSSYRAWHALGQGVLRIDAKGAGRLAVTPGIKYSGTKAPEPVIAGPDQPLAGQRLDHVKDRVEQGVHSRLHGEMRKPDEHWLQAVLRDDPTVLGIEQPALREVPAWRPVDAPSPKGWKRGYLDLAGLDGHGDIRLVETKVAKNKDELLLQGLDYYVWARAHAHVVRTRLGAAQAARLQLHYVIGADQDGNAPLHPLTLPQADALVDEVPWTFQAATFWYAPSRRAALDSHAVPGLSRRKNP